jgi:predicted DNA-binding transcriptional regulator YafY
LSPDRTTAIAAALDAAEQRSGAARSAALNALAKQVDGDAGGARDADRVRMMSAAIKALAAASK